MNAQVVGGYGRVLRNVSSSQRIVCTMVAIASEEPKVASTSPLGNVVSWPNGNLRFRRTTAGKETYELDSRCFRSLLVYMMSFLRPCEFGALRLMSIWRLSVFGLSTSPLVFTQSGVKRAILATWQSGIDLGELSKYRRLEPEMPASASSLDDRRSLSSRS